MFRPDRLPALIGLVVLLAVPARAVEAPRVQRLYVFGDSYSDTGAGYVDGNGPTAVAYFAQRLGLELKPATRAAGPGDSLNFAVSGAQTGRGAGRLVKGARLGLGMAEQVDDFVARVRAGQVVFDPESTLFFLAGGLNDRRLASADTVANLIELLTRLYGAGARRFSVALLPTAIPPFAEVGLRLNPELAGIPDRVRPRLPGARVALSRWGAFFDDVLRNPGAHGIENTTDACAGRAIFDEDATPCARPSASFFYHVGHPSTAVHRVVGDRLYAEEASR